MIPMPRTAVVETRCQYCGGRIPAGSKYMHLSSMNKGDAVVLIVCLSCNLNDAKEALR